MGSPPLQETPRPEIVPRKKRSGQIPQLGQTEQAPQSGIKENPGRPGKKEAAALTPPTAAKIKLPPDRFAFLLLTFGSAQSIAKRWTPEFLEALALTKISPAQQMTLDRQLVQADEGISYHEKKSKNDTCFLISQDFWNCFASREFAHSVQEAMTRWISRIHKSGPTSPGEPETNDAFKKVIDKSNLPPEEYLRRFEAALK